VIEAVCWDRDRFRKEYLGEFCLSVPELFPEGAMRLDDPANEVSSLSFISNGIAEMDSS
jgi:hypothetical protein